MSCGHKWKVLDTTFYCVELSGHQCAHYYKILPSDVQRFAERAERAEAELAAARADAERYRWLRANAVGCGMHMGAVLYTPELVIPRNFERHADTDAAIDAARSA